MSASIEIPVPEPDTFLIVASDGAVYATLPVTREMLSDRFPELVETLDDGLGRMRRAPLGVPWTGRLCSCPDVDVSTPADLERGRRSLIKGWAEDCAVPGHRRPS